MPGFNGSGPRGNGAMTGRGLGYCMNYVGNGMSRGIGLGRGGGLRCRRNNIQGGDRQETVFLREQVARLEEALEQARERIDQLEQRGK
ncbi:MAG: DUF5320 domain-containing protein [Bacillota bacterium]